MSERALRLVSSKSLSRNVRYVQTLRERAHALYPTSDSLAEKWLQARLRLGLTKPRVRIGCQRNITFPRTLREAGIHGGFE